MSKDVNRQSMTPKGQRILNLPRDRITSLLAPPPMPSEQRVTFEQQRVREAAAQEIEQRVINDEPILTIPRISDAPGIMTSRNPTAKRQLKVTPRIHGRVTRNNIPEIMTSPVAPATYIPIPSGAQQRIVTRHAIHMLTEAKRQTYLMPTGIYTVRFTPVRGHGLSVAHGTLLFTNGSPRHR
jgi:hypothetical protein